MYIYERAVNTNFPNRKQASVEMDYESGRNLRSGFLVTTRWPGPPRVARAPIAGPHRTSVLLSHP